MTESVKARNQVRFGATAQGYVASAVHAESDDLQLLVELAQPQPDWLVLDVATGGGHTARSFAPHVKQVIASDLTPPMLSAARGHHRQRGLANIWHSGADAEYLPFASNTFDLVTCRIAPHHFPEPDRFVRESARILKPGGFLIVQDTRSPNDPDDARYTNAFEALRDPSHVEARSLDWWSSAFIASGLVLQAAHTAVKQHSLREWTEIQRCTPEVVERLQIMLMQAPPAVQYWFQPQDAGTPSARFWLHYAIVMGQKA